MIIRVTAPMALEALEPFDSAEADNLRREAHGMARACLDAILSVAGHHNVEAVHAKGSAYRTWDSVIDYVPEFSDVDVHVRLTNTTEASGILRTLEQTLSVAEQSLRLFSERFPDARHVPRPQILLANDLEKLPGYLPSPIGSVHPLLGRSEVGASRAAYADTRLGDRTRFEADSDFVRDKIPLKVIDRPGHLLWRAVWLVPWRVGPAGPRILTQLDEDPFDAWSMNRTEVVGCMIRHGLHALAQAYTDFYMAGWAGFRSQFQTGEPAAEALRSAQRVFDLGRDLIEAHHA